MTTDTIRHLGTMNRRTDEDGIAEPRWTKVTLCGFTEGMLSDSERFVLLGEPANCPACIAANIKHAEDVREREFAKASAAKSGRAA